MQLTDSPSTQPRNQGCALRGRIYLFIYLFGITLLKRLMYVNIGASIKTISKYNSYNS